jgi:hypothetical protein
VYGCCKNRVYTFCHATDPGCTAVACTGGVKESITSGIKIKDYIQWGEAVSDVNNCKNGTVGSSSAASSAASSVTSSNASSAQSSSASSVKQKFKRLSLWPNPGCNPYTVGENLDFMTVYRDEPTCILESPKLLFLVVCKYADACKLVSVTQCYNEGNAMFPANKSGKNNAC